MNMTKISTVCAALMGCAAIIIFAQLVFAQELSDKYSEKVSASSYIRAENLLQLKTYLQKEIDLATARSSDFLQPDFSSPEKYACSVEKFRDKLKALIGYPPPDTVQNGKVRKIFIGEDRLCKIYRVWVEVLDGLETYGIYQVPQGLTAPAPLIICQHGGGGNPELMCNFERTGNYGDMVRRALQRGYVTWSPLAIMETKYPEPDPPIEGVNVQTIDNMARQIGTTSIAIDVYKISKGLEALTKQPEVKPDKVGMIGLSFGGYMTLWTAALNTEIDVAVSSGSFRDIIYSAKNQKEFTRVPHLNILNTFCDAILVGLICPRAFMVEHGQKDAPVMVDGARRETIRAQFFYDKLGLSQRYRYIEHTGGHEFRGDEAYDFLDACLKDR